MSDALWLAVGAVAYSLFSMALQYTLGNRRRVQAIQKEMQDIQKEFQKAAKSGDETQLKRLDERQKHMTGMMFESMKYQFKPMLVILPSFILLFGGFGFDGILTAAYPHFAQTLPLALHLTGNELLGLNIFHDSVYGVRGYFLVVMFFSGIFLQLIAAPHIEKLFYK